MPHHFMTFADFFNVPLTEDGERDTSAYPVVVWSLAPALICL